MGNIREALCPRMEEKETMDFPAFWLFLEGYSYGYDLLFLETERLQRMLGLTKIK